MQHKKILFSKTNRRTYSPNLFILSRNSKCFGQFLCPSSGVFHCTFGTGICHAGMMTAFKLVQFFDRINLGNLVCLLILLKKRSSLFDRSLCEVIPVFQHSRFYTRKAV
jgi:hypothetical protein